MKNLIKIAFGICISASLISCAAYNDNYATYGDPYYNDGFYYAPTGYYGNGGFWGNDGYYYRNDLRYYYDNGVPYYYGNNRTRIYVEQNRSGGNGTVTGTQRPNNGIGNGNNSYRYNNSQRNQPRNSNSVRSQSNRNVQPQRNSGMRNQTQPSQNNSGNYRNNTQNSQGNSNQERSGSQR